MRPANKPTAEQLEALTTFARANGRYWKAVLREYWMAGGYTETGSYIDGHLQQVLTELGAGSWLTRFESGLWRWPKI
jgi:hypothetical protein